MKHVRPDCNVCSGLDNCNKYCPVKVGESIVKFVNNLDCIETSIGSYRVDESTGLKTLIVSGYMLEKGSNPIDILVKLENCEFSLRGKLSDCMGLNPLQLLKSYTINQRFDVTVQNKAIEDLRRFTGNGVIPVPFKIGTDIEVIHNGFDGRKQITSTKVNVIKWVLNKESRELEAFMIADVGRNEDGSTYLKIKMSEYGVTWYLPNVERNLKTADVTREAVRMNNIGLILPVEVSDGETTVAVDGRHMFYNKNGTDIIIGNWGDSKMEISEEYRDLLHKTKAFKKLESYLKFIEKHARLIIPYGLTVANEIKV